MLHSEENLYKNVAISQKINPQNVAIKPKINLLKSSNQTQINSKSCNQDQTPSNFGFRAFLYPCFHGNKYIIGKEMFCAQPTFYLLAAVWTFLSAKKYNKKKLLKIIIFYCFVKQSQHILCKKTELSYL